MSGRIACASHRRGEEHEISQEERHARARALILLAAFVSFLLSVGLFFFGDETDGIFVGIWVPSILALGAFIAPRGGDGR